MDQTRNHSQFTFHMYVGILLKSFEFWNYFYTEFYKTHFAYCGVPQGALVFVFDILEQRHFCSRASVLWQYVSPWGLTRLSYMPKEATWVCC